MRVALIVNEGAGSDDCRALAQAALQRLRAAGVDAELTLCDGGAEVIAATERALAQRVDAVAAGGGDGTQSAVASRLAGTGIAQGVLPLGTLNHFAKDLGIPLDPGAAADVIAQGHTRAVDVGEVNGRTFINNSSLGLYPDIVADRERQRRRLGKGKWRALANASLRAAQRYPLIAVHVDGEDQRLTRLTPFVFVGNNEYTMAGFSIGERPRLDAGELTLYIARHPGRFGLFLLALRALFHRLEQARDFDVLRGAEFRIDTQRREERVAFDGEVARLAMPLQYRIRPKALRVLVPAAVGK